MWEREKMRGPVTEAKRSPGEGDGDDTQENGAADAPNHQDGDEHESRSSETHLRVGDFAQPDEGGGIGDDDIRVAQPNKRDEQADAGGGAVFEAIRDAVDDLFADVGEREEQKEQSG